VPQWPGLVLPLLVSEMNYSDLTPPTREEVKKGSRVGSSETALTPNLVKIS
jgi:hypothetical protein